jgi:hypothetical protein
MRTTVLLCLVLAGCTEPGDSPSDASSTSDAGRTMPGRDASDDGGSRPREDAGPLPEGLIGEADLIHQGSFRVPDDIHVGSSGLGFEYGGTALGYNPARDSLFLAGHAWDQLSAEIGVPELGGRAPLLQPLTDAFEGRGDEIGEGSIRVGGHLVYGDRLFVTEYLYYDAPGTATLSHFIRPLDLSARGELEGPFEVGSLGAGFYAGYQATIPAAWQEELGGPVLTGNCCLSIISRTSYGPAVFSIDPDDIGTSDDIASPLVYYPSTHPELGEYCTTEPNEYWSGATSVTGVVFPEGSASVLFFGTHATGECCYGEGTDEESLHRTPVPDEPEVIYCYDPAVSSKGTHGFPYRHYVWAYDANELARVHAGEIEPWEVRPYDVWELDVPGASENGSNPTGGAAYDRENGRIFLSQMFGEGERPLIHVYTVAER